MQTLIDQKQQQLITLIDESFLKELFEVEVYVPQLKEKIIAGCKWAFVMKERFTEEGYPKKATQPASYDIDSEEYSDSHTVAFFNMTQIIEAEKLIKKFEKKFVASSMFKDIIYEKTVDMFSTVKLDDVEVDVKTKKITFKHTYLDEFFQYFTPVLTVPPCQDIFDIQDDTPKWLWEMITKYEEWTWKMQKQLGVTEGYIQIGGYSSLAQTEPQYYIAQVNNDVGDAGSVVIEYSHEQDKIEGYVDMY